MTTPNNEWDHDEVLTKILRKIGVEDHIPAILVIIEKERQAAHKQGYLEGVEHEKKRKMLAEQLDTCLTNQEKMNKVGAGAAGQGMCGNCGGTVEYASGRKQCRYGAYGCKD